MSSFTSPNSTFNSINLMTRSSTTSVIDNIGNTPLVKLTKMCPNPLVEIYVKVEYVNPSGSIKDRIVKYIIEELEKKMEKFFPVVL